MKFLVFFSLACVLTNCAPKTPNTNTAPPPGQLYKSTKAEHNLSSVSDDKRENVSIAMSDFGIDIFKTLAKSSGDNIFISPYSLSNALVMTYAGARGNTAKEIKETMHFTGTDDDIHAGFALLNQALADGHHEGTKATFSLANNLFAQSGDAPKTAFLDVLASYYDAGISLMDFINSANPSRIAINTWVEKQTANKIVNLIPEGGIDHLTRFVLVNAVYFKGKWKDKFRINNTHGRPFHLLDGKTISAPTMHQTANFAYASDIDYQAIIMPYKDSSLEAMVILPKNYANFEKALDAKTIADINARFSSNEVELSMPKFTFRSEFALASALTELGMKDAFNDDLADFSGIMDTRLAISNVYHQGYVAVDEKGTEAAVAAAVVGTEPMAAAPMPREVMTIDRPFIFLIREHSTKAIMFLGRILFPVL